MARELFFAIQNDFSAVVVLLDFSADFDHLAGELTHVSDALHVVREDHDRKRAQAVIFTEVEIMGFASRVNANHLARDAFGFADVFGCLVERDAIGAKGGSRE